MKTILFVDDSEGHRFLLKENLSEEGFKVVTANNNDEVLSKYREFNPDLIITQTFLGLDIPPSYVVQTNSRNGSISAFQNPRRQPG